MLVALLVAVLAPAPFAPQEHEPPLAQDTGGEAGVEQASPLDEFAWQFGPGVGDMGRWATVQIPDGWRFLAADETQRLMELMENPVSDTEAGFLAPPDMEWFCVFEFDLSGYVEDDEKSELDADRILESLREGTEQSNEERRSRGWETLEIIGWVTEPRYDEATHNLEWATRARASGGGVSVNHNTRLLGRRGVMSATLVCNPDDLAAALPMFKEALGGFDYKPGERYAEFRSGDKVAEYGLAALVAGGAGVVAARTGLLSKLWKFILPALVAVGAFFKKFFGGKKETARTRT